jgi:Effector Associated Constant Component 1
LTNGNRRTDLRLCVAPRTYAYEEHDDRWLDQVGKLYGELREEVGEVVVVVPPAAGQKGALEQIVLMLQSLNALYVALEFFKTWVGRDRTRELVLSWTDDSGQRRKVEIRGKAISDHQLRELTAIATKRFGEG